VIKTHMVVLTGTAMDEPYLAPIKKQFENHKQVKVLQNILSTQELLQILKSSLAVVAPSTGVAHLSAALGAKTIGIYPPVLVQHPRRWAARGDHVQILSPSVNCPAKFSCLGEKCADYDCLKKITPDDVYRKI